MNIWIVNPFDELPGDTDIRHRYWSLADSLAQKGHTVTWWSSDFSHRAKKYRKTDLRPTTFDLRLIHTSPYTRNVSLARLRNHRQFARRFLSEAIRSIAGEGGLPPDRIVVSLPPLGTADAAFKIREHLGGPDKCQVILDIMDAWPETFYRAFPALVPTACPAKHRVEGWLRERILFPLHAAATRAYRGADRISAVSQIYIDLAKSHSPKTPSHLCYHGIDLETSSESLCLRERIPTPPLKITYIGALERSYDLETAIRAVHQLNQERHKVELHIAGAGTQEPSLKNLYGGTPTVAPAKGPGGGTPSVASANGRDRARPSIYFHGLLNRDDLADLLASSHLGLIPMRQDSWVGLPYKLADYCAAGLPVISSLDGECRQLLDTKKAGFYYEPGNTDALISVLKAYLQNPERLTAEGGNARQLAEEQFDRAKTYPELADFILTPS